MPSSLTKKIALYVLAGLVSLTLLALGYVHVRAEDWVADFLQRKIPTHINLEYDHIQTNILNGSITITNVEMAIKDRDSLKLHTTIQLNSISLIDLEYGPFFLKDNIVVSQLDVDKPEVNYYISKDYPQKKKERQGVVSLLKTIEVEKLKVVEGVLTVHKNDSTTLKAASINFEANHIQTSPEQIKKRIPVTYGSYDLDIREVFVDLGAYEKLTVKELKFHDGNVRVEDLTLASKYDRQKLSEFIPVERDYVNLKIPEIQLDSIEVSFIGDSLSVTTGNGKIINPIAEIYRDKLVKDDVSQKKLYSQMLRELPLYLHVPKVEIEQGNLTYSEKIKEGVPPGMVSFHDLNATIAQVNNKVKYDGVTDINAKALLMGHAPIELNWQFDVTNKNDAFLASGIVKDFKSNTLNSFLESSLRAKAQGTIDRLYFTISADGHSSTGDIKMKYDDFEFAVLKKDRLGVNKFLTFLGNLFVNDGSKSDAQGFRYGSIEVQRDPTKSFFNYLWINVQDGMVNTMLGRGKKEDAE
ncbi:hypothetical protein [Cytophaga sp. FL35]|uniref:hypothetical protein n=1 Tax=Cytophaga sp. FL35 TaxID=1904456 RepID=UPI001653607A|nr:hypothetical protein [Cytophaga sp. FL35]MBC6998122.1 hypothetical protein [Cytophaga sp. FL35]